MEEALQQYGVWGLAAILLLNLFKEWLPILQKKADERTAQIHGLAVELAKVTTELAKVTARVEEMHTKLEGGITSKATEDSLHKIKTILDGYDGILKVLKTTSDEMKAVHDEKDEDGVRIWYVRKSLRDAVEFTALGVKNILSDLSRLAATQERNEALYIAIRAHVESISKQLERLIDRSFSDKG